MGNFKLDGHIAEEGFQRMLKNQCTTLERLELAEHISFCNPCLERYLSLVEQGKLLIPKEGMKEDVLQKAQKDWFGDFRKRLAQATVAASIFLMCWSVGGAVTRVDHSFLWLTGRVEQTRESITEKWNGFTEKAFGGYWDLLDGTMKEEFKDGKK